MTLPGEPHFSTLLQYLEILVPLIINTSVDNYTLRNETEPKNQDPSSYQGSGKISKKEKKKKERIPLSLYKLNLNNHDIYANTNIVILSRHYGSQDRNSF